MRETNGNHPHPSELALQALVWALSEETRASRLLALTGLTPDGLRGGIGDTGTQAAILAFLENHEPDLVACAADIGTTPKALVAARMELEA
jgi:cysteine synthase